MANSQDRAFPLIGRDGEDDRPSFLPRDWRANYWPISLTVEAVEEWLRLTFMSLVDLEEMEQSAWSEADREIIAERATVGSDVVYDIGILVLLLTRNGVALPVELPVGESFSQVRARQLVRDVWIALPCEAPSKIMDHSDPKRPPKTQWLADAMLMVRDNPHLSDATIAKKVERQPADPTEVSPRADAEVTPLDPIAQTESGSVLLFGRGDHPVVKGKKKPTLTDARYNVVLTLLQVGDDGLTKDELDRKSGHTDARKLLKAIADSDSDWKAVISFPGTSGKGYRIR